MLTRWPFVLVGVLYLLTSPYHQGLNNPNEMVRVYMTKAWIDTGDFAIQPVIRKWGMVDDKAVRDGQLYSSKAPLQSLLGGPAYAIAPTLLDTIGTPQTKRTITIVVRLFGAAVYGIAFAWILLAWCRRRSAELGASTAMGTVVGLGIALGTMVYPYSITFTGHGIAALTAGGCYLAVVGLSRVRFGSRDWITIALLAGFLGGAAPFSEYPAALVAGPALIAAFFVTAGLGKRLQLLGALAAGGALPFGIGLWAHWRLWGHPLRTGYGFLENQSYVQVHGEGFFGVSFPKGGALVGALFSPGTGLFFYSPLLIVGLLAVIAGLRSRTDRSGPTNAQDNSDHQDTPDRERHAGPLARPLAIAALIGFIASVYFISAHKGWRGGWTVGPRYIVAVAPVLGIWAVEALRWRALRPVVASLAALSILTTGFAAALYPHLSDVYTNPLATFLWPSYIAGEMTYGLAHTWGLEGHAANAVHVAPLVVAIGFCLWTGLTAASITSRVGRLTAVIGPILVGCTGIALWPERDPAAAHRENRRLWGFWEPAGPGDGPMSARRLARPGRVYRARAAYRQVRIEAEGGQGQRSCGPFRGGFCMYGDQPWQRFGPEKLTMAGIPEDVLFLHPIAGQTVRARLPVRTDARRLVLRYGLADASVHADNPHPINIAVRQGANLIGTAKADPVEGLKSLELAVTSTRPVTLELTVKQDGARVFGFDVEQYR